jgi:hypothetical protein
MLDDLRRGMVGGDEDIGKRFVGRSRLIRLASSSKASVSVRVETNSMRLVAAIMRAMRLSCPAGRA